MKNKISYVTFFITIISLFIFNACKHDRLKIDISEIELTLEVYNFEKILFENPHHEVYDLLLAQYNNHDEFIDIYTESVLQIGNIEDEFMPEYLHSFLTDTVIRRTADTTLAVFEDFRPIANAIEKGFKHYKHYFPDYSIPAIYTYISGFNESLIIAENFIGISLDKYLGSKCEFYPMLGIPVYKSRNMYPQKIISDLFYAWAITEFQNNDNAENLLSQMIHHGKLIYFTKAMNPSLPDSIIMGYTAEQIKWSKVNEASMWNYIVERREIYNSDRLLIQRYINDSPFTHTFSSESPGRTGIWLGWQIVTEFMNNNEDITLKELMNMNNAQEILNRSGYHP